MTSKNGIMSYFNEKSQGENYEIFRQFSSLANKLDYSIINSPEKSAGLRKLLEAKDCFNRAIKPRKD